MRTSHGAKDRDSARDLDFVIAQTQSASIAERGMWLAVDLSCVFMHGLWSVDNA